MVKEFERYYWILNMGIEFVLQKKIKRIRSIAIDTNRYAFNSNWNLDKKSLKFNQLDRILIWFSPYKYINVDCLIE